MNHVPRDKKIAERLKKRADGSDSLHELVSNWGDLSSMCAYGVRHNNFRACCHKEADATGVCFDPASCPMIKKWAVCRMNDKSC